MSATLAASALRVPHSRIRELAEVAKGMDGVLKLYFGESNLPTPEYIKRAAQKAMADGFTFYTENAGLPSLRKALALTIDRKSFIDIMTEGQAKIGAAMLPPPEGLWGITDIRKTWRVRGFCMRDPRRRTRSAVTSGIRTTTCLFPRRAA